MSRIAEVAQRSSPAEEEEALLTQLPGARTHTAANSTWWTTTLRANSGWDVDTDTDRLLDEADWPVLRIWEHEPVVEAADRVHAAPACASR